MHGCVFRKELVAKEKLQMKGAEIMPQEEGWADREDGTQETETEVGCS